MHSKNNYTYAYMYHWQYNTPTELVLCPSDAPTRHKRGRYYEPGSQVSETAEQKLESLITRVGEKVKTNRHFYLDTLHFQSFTSQFLVHVLYNLHTLLYSTKRITVYMRLSFHVHTAIPQGNKSLQNNLEALSDILQNEIASSSVKDKILRTICSWSVNTVSYSVLCKYTNLCVQSMCRRCACQIHLDSPHISTPILSILLSLPPSLNHAQCDLPDGKDHHILHSGWNS